MRFGQRIGAFLLYGVLGSHDEERVIEFVGVFADGYLPLLHGFEQGALHFGRGAVYFICQYEVGKYGTFLYLKLLFCLTVHHRTHDVGGEQVGRKLYAVVLGVDKRCQCFNSKGLCQSGHTFEQNVSVGKQTYHQRIDQMLLPDDDLVHAHRNHIDKRTFARNQLVQFPNIYCLAHNYRVFLWLYNSIFLLQMYA